MRARLKLLRVGFCEDPLNVAGCCSVPLLVIQRDTPCANHGRFVCEVDPRCAGQRSGVNLSSFKTDSWKFVSTVTSQADQEGDGC